MKFHLVHFKSRELSETLPFGRFWHIFASNGGFIIDQDHNHTFTAHFPVHLLDAMESDPREIVYRALGSKGNKHRIQIDKVLVDSEWTPNFSIADQYHTDNLRVFLAGDAGEIYSSLYLCRAKAKPTPPPIAHRNPPHGGYGMNSGIVDAIDLGWRLAAIVKGYGGPLLLNAYTLERRPMMIRSLVRSYRHLSEHIKLAQLSDSVHLNASTPEGENLRKEIDTFLQSSAPETRDRGIEFDLRYYHSPIVVQDHSVEVGWEVGRYTPSTRPGSRAPHVFLDDGMTSIYDTFGTEFTLVQFEEVEGVESSEGYNEVEGESLSASASDILISTASTRGIPLKHAHIKNEPHVHEIWERELVLVRPDTHVAWRGSCAEVLRLGEEGVHGIWDVVTGYVSSSSAEKSPAEHVATERAFEEIVKDFLGEIRGREELGIQY